MSEQRINLWTFRDDIPYNAVRNWLICKDTYGKRNYDFERANHDSSKSSGHAWVGYG